MFHRAMKTILLIGAAGSGLAVGAPAFAQDAPESSSAAGDIIVTARRVEERLQDVPISMTVFDNQQIANRNITIATDLATYTPSLSVNQRYGPEKSSFAIRGFNQDQSTAPTVGVYFAEVVGVRAQGGTTSGNSVGAGAFMDLQNVQILKGPQGTLFGRNTTGGAILLTPRKPTDNLEGYVEGSIGNYDLRRVQAALNVPLAETFKVRAAIDRQKRDGYMHNLSGVGPKDYNDRDYFAARLSIVADLTPDLENYTIFHYSDSDTNGYARRIVGCDPNPITDPTNPRFSGTRILTAGAGCEQAARQAARGDSLYDVETRNADPFLKIKQWQVINTTTWRASDTLTIKNIASYGEFRERANFDLYSSNFFVPQGGFNPSIVNPQIPSFTVPAGTPFQYIVLDTAPGLDNSAQSTFTEELQIQGNTADNKFTYVIGGYLEFSRPLGLSAGRTGIFLNCIRPQDLTCTNPLLFGSISESATELSFDNHGIFAQGTYNFTDQLALTAGLRWTFDKITGFTQSTRASIVPPGTPGSIVDASTGVSIRRQCTDSFRHGNGFVTSQDQCRTELTNKSDEPTWVINLDYKPMPDLLLYAKWARGYRQGGINFTNPGIELWDPEKMDTYEAGAKFSFRGSVSGYFNLAAFYNDLSDQQVFGGLISNTPGVAGGAAIINAGKARVYGAEVDASATFFDSLRFDLGYTYLNTKIQEIDVSGIDLTGTPFGAIVPSVTEGSPFVYAPKHKLSLTGTYTLPIDESLGRVSLGATWVYTSKQISDAGMPPYCTPTGPGCVSMDGKTHPLGVIPSYSVINLNVNWDSVGGSPFDLAFFVTNLTKEVYPVATGGGFVSAGFGDLQMGEPRMYGMRLRYTFGR